MYFERIPVELTHRGNADFNEIIPQGSQLACIIKIDLEWKEKKMSMLTEFVNNLKGSGI